MYGAPVPQKAASTKRRLRAEVSRRTPLAAGPQTQRQSLARRAAGDRSLLTLTNECQQQDLAVRKFERIVMGHYLFLVDLSKESPSCGRRRSYASPMGPSVRTQLHRQRTARFPVERRPPRWRLRMLQTLAYPFQSCGWSVCRQPSRVATLRVEGCSHTSRHSHAGSPPAGLKSTIFLRAHPALAFVLVLSAAAIPGQPRRWLPDGPAKAPNGSAEIRRAMTAGSARSKSTSSLASGRLRHRRPRRRSRVCSPACFKLPQAEAALKVADMIGASIAAGRGRKPPESTHPAHRLTRSKRIASKRVGDASWPGPPRSNFSSALAATRFIKSSKRRPTQRPSTAK